MRENVHEFLTRSIVKLIQEDDGGEVLEYVFILGIVIVVTIATVTGFGNKIMAKWTSVNTSM